MKKVYILYDSRAEDGDTDDATIYTTAQTLKEAIEDKNTMFPDAVIYEYDLQPRKGKPDLAINEKRIVI